MVALPSSTFLLSPGDEVVKHGSPGIFNTFAFKKTCMRSLHAQTPVRSSFTSEPTTRVLVVGLHDLFEKEGRRVRYNLQTN